jgi:hypothetical protein
MSPIVGSCDLVGIEFELEEPRDERWLFGHFRLCVRAEQLGDWNDVVSLRAVTSWWEAFVDADVQRREPQLDGLDHGALVDLLADSAYGGR